MDIIITQIISRRRILLVILLYIILVILLYIITQRAQLRKAGCGLDGKDQASPD